MNALLNYPGAKWGMASQIVSLMPPHRSYLEPFFGSGAVLFNKPPSAIETVNDIDGDIVNFFRVLREQPEKLAMFISLTPYSRDVFNDAHEDRGTSDFERAYKFAIRSKMGFGFKTYTKTGFKVDVQGREGSYAVNNWNRMPADLLEAAARLKNVQVENRPALDLIRKYNYAHAMQNDADAMQSDAPILSNPILSSPIQSYPIQSKESKADEPPAPAKAARKSYGEFGWVKLTDEEYRRLLNDLGEAEVKRCIAYIDESAQSTRNKNKWRDWNLVVRRCAKDGWGLDNHTRYSRQKVPMGATGVLGEAELEAIQRVLKEG